MKRCTRSETQNWWSRDCRDNEWRPSRVNGDVTNVKIPPAAPNYQCRDSLDWLKEYGPFSKPSCTKESSRLIIDVSPIDACEMLIHNR